ncbi:GGDEF domain-containing protein [Pseudoteredinibacter isoporae]|uniref:diguanylate cyclase n=1 Tax=Pseudoteredinibacter isoporae TaxID=570281 RepID=A0A7X0JX89_9GAMM|nr:GGDEF domain-containing protein [Pseudoteredinibacter isoporae]MBB6523195.1 diguanylate cyclase (GGDEF)-like protein [Pseudoteredinibacter isoporae]NHO88713.1 GGDEF domain-containing protein [Pseudoteredinibacter isoporae]NIB22596.1 GGDEF domain-containing protein [Pseudoteredinibacter isoporae]
MEDLNLLSWGAGDKVITTFQKRLLVIITALCLLGYIPFTYVSALNGNHSIVFANAGFSIFLTLFVSFSLITQKRAPLLLIFLTLLFLLISSTLPILYVGQKGLFWFFPITLSVSFLFPAKIALIFGTLELMFSSAFAAIEVESPMSIRFIYAATFTLVFCNLISFRLHRNQAHLISISVTDAMTGLLNRHALDQQLQRSWNIWKEKGIPSVVAMIDLDKLKEVNDSHGHDVGDKNIIAFSYLAKSMIRKNDTIFRIGGDEFLIILEGTNYSGSLRVLNELKQRTFDSSKIITTISTGAASISGCESIDEWIKRADQSLYKAKEQGRNYVEFSKNWESTTSGRSHFESTHCEKLNAN